MSAKIIDGKKIAEKITKDVRRQIVENEIEPGLAVFLVGDDKPSHVYVSLKEKASKKTGIAFHKYEMEADAKEEEIISAIKFLNNDSEINAILVQLPLPESINEDNVINAIDPKKDVDGFHPETVKKFMAGEIDFVPGLTMGIIRLIESTKINLDEKKATIICNSEIFSNPIKKILEDKNVEVEVSHPDDNNLETKTLQADILITATGRPEMVKAKMIKEGAVIIDVGTTKVKGKLKGDVDFNDTKQKAGFITPVPGGVGPVTVALLLENTLKLALEQRN